MARLHHPSSPAGSSGPSQYHRSSQHRSHASSSRHYRVDRVETPSTLATASPSPTFAHHAAGTASPSTLSDKENRGGDDEEEGTLYGSPAYESHRGTSKGKRKERPLGSDRASTFDGMPPPLMPRPGLALARSGGNGTPVSWREESTPVVEVPVERWSKRRRTGDLATGR